ncbi:MAG: hypothetical protein CL623_01970 [Arcobacter sp.]|nr:hypothetical protein [Arcobacter sp.]
MALEQITFNIGAFNDSDAGGNNYFTDTVFEVKNQSDNTFATIYSDSSGTTQIPQNGIDNVSNSRGECNFYIDDGDFYLEVNSQQKNFKTSKKASSISTAGGLTVQDHIDNSSGYNIDLLEVDRTGVVDESAKFSQAIDNAMLYGGGVLNIGHSGSIKVEVEKTISNLTIQGKAKLIGGDSHCLILHGDNNTLSDFDVQDTGRNTNTVWLDGDNNTALNLKVFNDTKSTSATALFGDLLRLSGNDSQILFCETYNGYTGIKRDGGNSPTSRVYGGKIWGCYSHDNIRGGTIKPEVASELIQSNRFNDNNVNDIQGSDGLLCERNVKDLNLQFNEFHNNGEHGLYLQDSFCNVSDNHANDNHASGLKFGGKKNGNFNDSNGALTDAEYNAQYISEDCIISHNHTYRNGLGKTDSGIYIQETHRGYSVSFNIVKDNEYGIRAVNQQLGGEIENITLTRNTVTGNIQKDLTLAVTDFANMIGGTYGVAETFMPDRVFNLIEIIGSKIGTLNTASVQNVILKDSHINDDWNTSSAGSIKVKGGSITSTSDINIANFTSIESCDISLDGDYQITATAQCNIESMVDVNIYAPDSTGNVYNIPDTYAPNNTTFSNIMIFESSGVRAMDIYGDGHTVSGVKANTVSGQDVVRIRGNDCSVNQCSSRLSTSARVTASGDNNIIMGNQLTAIDSGTGNIRMANRSEP